MRSAAVVERIRGLAHGSTVEICGALLADSDGIIAAIPLNNQSREPATGFFIPAAEIARVEREAEQQGRILAGFYHSHPDGTATPSTFDLDLAVPGYIYWIAGGEDVRAWRLREDRSGFDEVMIS